MPCKDCPKQGVLGFFADAALLAVLIAAVVFVSIATMTAGRPEVCAAMNPMPAQICQLINARSSK